MKGLAAVVLLGSVGLCGCAPQYSLVGTWTYDGNSSSADEGTTYNADGTGEDWWIGRAVDARHTWKWRMEGDRLYSTPLTNSKKGVTQAAPDQKENLIGTIRWINKDKYSMTDTFGSTGTYSRKKQKSAAQ